MKYFIPCLFLMLASCGAPQDANYTPLPPPPSEKPQQGEAQVTPEQQAFFEKELKDLEKVFRSLGHKDSLKKIPIYLQAIKEPRAENDRGECLDGKEIRLSARNMAEDLESKDVLAGRLIGATRRTLIHQIGHCYFNKSHNNALLSKKGHLLVVKNIRLRVLPQTLMSTDVDQSGLPLDLTVYYVGELMKLWRAKTLEEVAKRTSGASVVSEKGRSDLEN